MALQDITFALCAKRMFLQEFKILDYAEIEIDRQVGGRVVSFCQTASLSNFRLDLEYGLLRYTTQISTKFVAAPEELDQISDSCGQTCNVLVYRFPQGHMRCTPVTSVVWQIGQTTVTMRSLHTFPDERALVQPKLG